LGIVLFIIMHIFSESFASLFSKDPSVIAVIALYFRIVPLGYGVQGIFNINSMVLNALNKPFHSAVLTLFQIFILYIPLAILGKYLWGTTGIFLSLVISYLVSGVISFILVGRVLKKLI